MKLFALFLFVLPCVVLSTSCFTSMDGVYTHRLKCENNDTHCGDWSGKVFKPVGCDFREVTTENAQKCMKNKTLACIGDSLTMGFCNGVGMVLIGVTEEDDAAHLDYIHAAYSGISSCDGCEHERPLDENYAGNYPIFPSAQLRDFNEYDFQVQSYFLMFDGTELEQMENMLNNRFDFKMKMAGKSIEEFEKNFHGSKTNATHRPHDFAIVNLGFHLKERFNSTPGRYGRDFMDNVVQDWVKMREKVKVPSVWTPMNGNCRAKLNSHWSMTTQVNVIEEVNYVAKKEFAAKGLPYFDFDVISRVPMEQRCEISKDGAHMKGWPELTKGRMLLNYLCDDEWNWVGDWRAFVEPVELTV